MMREQTLWDMMDDPHCIAPHTRDLMRWSLSFDLGHRPFELFCDIIGFTEETGGSRAHSGSYDSIRHMEADYLGEALCEWANNPAQVEAWLWAATSAEE